MIGHFKMWYVVILSICLCKGGKLFVIFSWFLKLKLLKPDFSIFFIIFPSNLRNLILSNHRIEAGTWEEKDASSWAQERLTAWPGDLSNPEKPRGHLKSFEKICIKKRGNCLGFTINIQISSELVKFLNLSSLTRKYGSYVTSQADWELWEMWTM